jgi:hypothetical protein
LHCTQGGCTHQPAVPAGHQAAAAARWQGISTGCTVQ